MRYLRFYITPEDIVERLEEKADNTKVVFTKAEICAGGCLEVACLVAGDEIKIKLNIPFENDNFE